MYAPLNPHTLRLAKGRGSEHSVHTYAYAYEQLEAASVGVIDFSIKEVAGEWRNFIAIKNMRDVGHDSRSHQFKIDENLQVTLEKVSYHLKLGKNGRYLKIRL